MSAGSFIAARMKETKLAILPLLSDEHSPKACPRAVAQTEAENLLGCNPTIILKSIDTF
jgi:hypothetical protein